MFRRRRRLFIRHPRYRVRHPVVAGGVLIVVGTALLLRAQGLLGAHVVWLVAPALLTLSAVARLALRPGPRAAIQAVAGLVVAGWGVLLIEHVGGWTVAATWPVVLIAAGAASVACALWGRPRPAQPNP